MWTPRGAGTWKVLHRAAGQAPMVDPLDVVEAVVGVRAMPSVRQHAKAAAARSRRVVTLSTTTRGPICHGHPQAGSDAAPAPVRAGTIAGCADAPLPALRPAGAGAA